MILRSLILSYLPDAYLPFDCGGKDLINSDWTLTGSHAKRQPSMLPNSDDSIGFTGGYASAPDGGIGDYPGRSPFSLHFIINRSNTNEDTYRRVLSKETAPIIGWWVNLTSTSDAIPNRIVMARRTSAFTTVSGPVLTAGVSYQVVFTYDGDHMKVYIDGALYDSAESSQSLGDSSSVAAKIAARGFDAAHRFQGLIDEVALFYYALTADQVTDLRHASF